MVHKMKFQQFLLESNKEHSHDNFDGYKKAISEEEAIKLIKTHCKNVDPKLPLWRGTKFKDEFSIVEGQKGGRKSANTSNHYTLIIDEILSTEYRHAPLRSKSIICSTSKRYASNYGLAHAVFPFDDVEIGKCEYDDIWYSDVYIGEHMNIKDVNSMLRYVIKEPESVKDIVNAIVEDMENGYDDCEDITRAIIDMYVDNHGQEEFDEADKESVVEEILYTAYHPEYALNMQFGTYKELEFGEREIDDDNEVWFGGKCVMIDMHTYNNMLRDGKFD